MALLLQDIAARVAAHVLMVLVIVPLLAARATKYIRRRTTSTTW